MVLEGPAFKEFVRGAGAPMVFFVGERVEIPGRPGKERRRKESVGRQGPNE